VNGIIYLDESGDLGWTFTAPYRSGGSSRHLTITAVCVPSAKKHLPKRIVRDLYDRFSWSTAIERKWVQMPANERTEFAREARRLCDQHADIHLHAIVVNKQKVEEHIRKDCNKLYNYMIRLALLGRMAAYEAVTLIPDPRSIKVKSGNSLPDYLQTELWFTQNVKTELNMQPVDSKNCLGIQFADMLAGVVQSKFEDGANNDFNIVWPKLKLNRLFF
jgi:Protein of unknown function (DUF3800)